MESYTENTFTEFDVTEKLTTLPPLPQLQNPDITVEEMPLYRRIPQGHPTSRGPMKPKGGRALPPGLCQHRLLINILVLSIILTLCTLAYSVYYTDGHLSILSVQQAPTYTIHSKVEIADVIEAEDLEKFNESFVAVYVFCGLKPKFDYYNYLSMASVMRTYDPHRIVILYEHDPPEMSGNWTMHSEAKTVTDLFKYCTAFEGFTKMRNSSPICDNADLHREFLMKLLLHYGGLYVGPKTFMTEVTSFLRSRQVSENILFYTTTEMEGFIYVRDKVGSESEGGENEDKDGGNQNVNKTKTITTTPHSVELVKKDAEKVGKKRVRMRVLKSREIPCFHSPYYASEILHHVNGNAFYSCVIMSESNHINPKGLMTLRSDFGQFARKAVFNIHNDWETRYYIRVSNASLVPYYCQNDDTGDMGLNF